ncbi:MAG: hypothetical protein KY055_00805 [Candidatus Nealsonbacteria bacterium]|nr:hypothetical protein [Candidatus Nealsonbacteria bacterium]
MLKKKLKDNFVSQKGFTFFYLIILVLAVVCGIVISFGILIVGQQEIGGNIITSTQSYFAAEAGIEDTLLRLVKKMKLPNSYSLKVGQSLATIEISDAFGGSRTITSGGSFLNQIRRIQVVYQVSTQKISFFYGAQIGDGGIKMQDTAKIEGNVFSNGSIVRVGGNPRITGTAIVAKNGNEINGLIIGLNANVHSCRNSKISGTLTYVQGGTIINCPASATNVQTEEIKPKDLPISQSQIEQWKSEGLAGGIISGNYTLRRKQEVFLGPKKIEGNLIIQDQAKLLLTGTIWVTGNITLEDRGQILLNPATYGSLSGLILADGKIIVQDRAKALGTGQAGSYLMLLSELDSVLTGSEAIVIKDGPTIDIIYASRGYILLEDSIILRQVSGYGLKLKDNAKVTYEVGLADTTFTSGPAGDWKVVSWKEIE